MKIISILTLSLLISSFAHANDNKLRLAITTTTENTGLMTVLNSAFQQNNEIELNVVTAGSGQALRLGEQGDVDVLLTHAPSDEIEFMSRAYGKDRVPAMHNDFVLLGPKSDPAEIKSTSSIIEAFKLINKNQAKFISRGDDSGTHKKETFIWQQAGTTPGYHGYIEAGVGMGAALLIANEQQAYILTDRGTYLAFKDQLSLNVTYQGDPVLDNPYHIITVNPEKHSNVNYKAAKDYLDFLVSNEAKEIINKFQINGESLFYPSKTVDSGKQEQTTEAVSNNYFLNAIVSSFTLIINLDKPLFFVVWTSLKVSLIAVLIASCIGIPLGVVVALNQFSGKTFLMACLNTLMALPTVVVGLLLYGLLNRQGLFGDFGLLYTPTAMVIGQAVLITPVIWNLAIAAINGADPRLSKTCTSLGANYLQRSLIYMSEVRFALIAAIVAGFGRAIGEVGIAMMLGGNINGYTRTMTTAIALETSKGEFEFALALGFMLLLVAFIVNALLQQFQLRVK